MNSKNSVKIGKDTFYVEGGYIYKNPRFDEDGNIRTWKDMIPLDYEKGKYFKSIQQHSVVEDRIMVEHIGRSDIYDLDLQLLGYFY